MTRRLISTGSPFEKTAGFTSLDKVISIGKDRVRAEAGIIIEKLDVEHFCRLQGVHDKLRRLRRPLDDVDFFTA